MRNILALNEFDAETRRKAEKVLLTKQKETDLNWGVKLKSFENMKIFHKCDDHIGMPKKEFLKRLINIRPFFRQSKNIEPFENMLNVSFTKLNDKSFVQDDVEKPVQELHKILSILAVSDFKKDALVWFENNGELTGMGLLQCLTHSNMYLVTETCYVSANIIRFLETNITFIMSQAIIKGCIDIISMRVLHKEDYIENYREERLKHDDLELFAGKELQFHWPKFESPANSREYSAIACSIYTLTFFFQYNPFPKIIFIFQNQIYRRREMARNILFKLYLIVIKNIDKNLTDTNGQWKKLPYKLYLEITKGIPEKNLINKKLISEITHCLHEISHTRFPSMTLNLYHNNGIESKTSIEKTGLSKTSIRMVLKVSTSKGEKEVNETTETSFTEDFDENLRDSEIYQRHSMISQDTANNYPTQE